MNIVSIAKIKMMSVLNAILTEILILIAGLVFLVMIPYSPRKSAIVVKILGAKIVTLNNIAGHVNLAHIK